MVYVGLGSKDFTGSKLSISDRGFSAVKHSVFYEYCWRVPQNVLLVGETFLQPSDISADIWLLFANLQQILFLVSGVTPDGLAHML